MTRPPAPGPAVTRPPAPGPAVTRPPAPGPAVTRPQGPPALHRPQLVDRPSLILSYAGVYASFPLHAEEAAVSYGVPQAGIMLELGRRNAVGGQEDRIIGPARELAARCGAAAAR